MERQYTVAVMKSDGNTCFLQWGFLKCVVKSCTSPCQQRQFAYCLHCKRLRSISWFYAHKQAVGFPVTPEWCAEMETGFERWARDINTEIDVIFDSGGLFKAPRSEARDHHSHSSRDGAERGSWQLPANPRAQDDSGGSLDLNSLLDSADDSPDEASSTFSARLANCVTECFEEFCFVNGSFDINHFLSLSQQLFNDDCVQPALGQDPVDILRGKVLSTVLRKVFVRLSLSKSQIDALNRLVKAIILFIVPNNIQLARSIHAGYLSCLREAMKRTDERDSNVHALFEQCRYFSIGLDTALFGQDNVLSCTVRLAFDDRIEQLPLFLSGCRASTGEELAAFVYVV